MPLHVVWTSRTPKRDAGEVIGERSRLLRTRLKRLARNNLPLTLGERVLYMEEPGCIIAINIAGMGRWPAHLYPFIVLLDCGLVIRCHAMDLEVETPQTGHFHTGKPESTGWV